MLSSILIVCSGNICRSPIGERLLKRLLPHINISSAGTRAIVDHGADTSAIRIAQQHELSLEGHRGQQLTRALMTKFDLILVMERKHLSQIANIAPEARSKSMLLGHWLREVEIPDPWQKSDEAFGHVYQLLDRACHTWVSKLGE